MIDLYVVAEKYPLISIEDGLDENDWDGWAALTQRLIKSNWLAMTFGANPTRLKRGIDNNTANSI